MFSNHLPPLLFKDCCESAFPVLCAVFLLEASSYTQSARFCQLKIGKIPPTPPPQSCLLLLPRPTSWLGYLWWGFFWEQRRGILNGFRYHACLQSFLRFFEEPTPMKISIHKFGTNERGLVSVLGWSGIHWRGKSVTLDDLMNYKCKVSQLGSRSLIENNEMLYSTQQFLFTSETHKK